MITIHPRFRSEAEALDAAARTVNDIWSIDVQTARRIADFTENLLRQERVHGYAGPYRAALDPATCPCAVCVCRRVPR